MEPPRTAPSASPDSPHSYRRHSSPPPPRQPRQQAVGGDHTHTAAAAAEPAATSHRTHSRSSSTCRCRFRRLVAYRIISTARRLSYRLVHLQPHHPLASDGALTACRSIPPQHTCRAPPPPPPPPLLPRHRCRWLLPTCSRLLLLTRTRRWLPPACPRATLTRCLRSRTEDLAPQRSAGSRWAWHAMAAAI
jgi:hypothetical protein